MGSRPRSRCTEANRTNGVWTQQRARMVEVPPFSASPAATISGTNILQSSVARSKFIATSASAFAYALWLDRRSRRQHLHLLPSYTHDTGAEPPETTVCPLLLLLPKPRLDSSRSAIMELRQLGPLPTLTRTDCRVSVLPRPPSNAGMTWEPASSALRWLAATSSLQVCVIRYVAWGVGSCGRDTTDRRTVQLRAVPNRSGGHPGSVSWCVVRSIEEDCQHTSHCAHSPGRNSTLLRDIYASLCVPQALVPSSLP